MLIAAEPNEVVFVQLTEGEGGGGTVTEYLTDAAAVSPLHEKRAKCNTSGPLTVEVQTIRDCAPHASSLKAITVDPL